MIGELDYNITVIPGLGVEGDGNVHVNNTQQLHQIWKKWSD